MPQTYLLSHTHTYHSPCLIETYKYVFTFTTNLNLVIVFISVPCRRELRAAILINSMSFVEILFCLHVCVMIYEWAINSDGLQNQWCLLLFLYVYCLSLYTFLYYIIISERCRRLRLSPPRHWEFHVSAHIICHHSACCGQINWLPTCMGMFLEERV